MAHRRYYHASPRRLRVGTVLQPAGAGARVGVYLTSGPAPHYTIAEEAVRAGWHVYEVAPLGAHVRYNGLWDEWLAASAVVVRYVASAARTGRGKRTTAVTRPRSRYFLRDRNARC